MLRLPESGFQPSVNTHNVDRDTLCDWIEASILFVDDGLSKMDVIDVLLEENVYRDQDFAKQLIDDAWMIMLRRQRALGTSAAFAGDGLRIKRNHSWRDILGHSFCMILTLRDFYKDWSDALGDEYVTQGDLFERFTAEALVAMGWDVHRTGWAGIKGVADYETAVTSLADILGEPSELGGLTSEAKDDGLDLVVHIAFNDTRGGNPIFLVQCASGRNWKSKLRTPSLNLWREIVRFSGSYCRGIAIPFSISDDQGFRRKMLAEDGVFWDRYRLLSAGRGRVDWLSPVLAAEIVQWVEPAVEILPAS